MATIRNAIIYVFSGTGNTKLAADSVQRYLLMNQIHTHVYNIRMNKKGEFENIPDPNNYDVCGFGYPVYAAQTPKFVLDFVKSLPECEGRKLGMPAFIFSTAGSPSAANKASSRSLAAAIRKKGMMPGIDMHMVMPFNIGIRVNDEEAKYMRVHTEKMARILAYMVKNRQFEPLKFNPAISAASQVGKLQRKGAKASGKKYTVDADRCIGCGICERGCPSSNITMVKGKPEFGDRCQMCMACVTYCPYMAIHPGMMDKFAINMMWDYDAIAYDESISDDALNNKKGAKHIYKNRKYYKETNELYDSIFSDEVSGRKAKRESFGRNVNRRAPVKVESDAIEIPETANAEEIKQAVKELAPAPEEIKENAVNSVNEKIAQTTRISLDEIRKLMDEQQKSHDELVNRIMSAGTPDEPGDQVSDDAHDGGAEGNTDSNSNG